jgi:hypothetical protein
MKKHTKVGLAASILAIAAVFCVVTMPAESQGSDDRPNDKIKGRYAFRMTPVKSFSADDLANQGGLSTAPRQDILRVGVFTADGDGNLTGHTIATTDTNAGVTWLITFDWTGKYAMNADGTGFFSVNAIRNLVCTDTTVTHAGNTPHPVTTGGTPLAGNVACTGDEEGHEDYAFVFTTRGGKRLEFIQTDNAGGGAKVVLTGVASAHESFGKDDDDDDEENND